MIADGWWVLNAGTFWLLDTGIPVSGVRSMSLALNERPFADLNDATLADEDTNSILMPIE